MKSNRQYQKLFSRDFCLSSVETWVRGESTNSKEWTDEKQPFLPYIITERSDDTVHFYYDLEGVEWVQNLLVKLANKDKKFILKIEKTVLDKLSFIRPIYENEEIITLPTLKRFIKELEAGYPWFEAMWWFFQMDDETKIAKLDLENLGRIRSLTDKLCNSSDTVIRNSLIKIYPSLGELSSVLRTDEIQSEIIPTKQELEARYKDYFFGNNQLFVNSNKSKVATSLDIHFNEIKVKKVKEFKGNVAQQGVVKGFVRRLMGHKQINELKQGEILVSPMTIPDFLPAMKKAAAFITDEGGILCHAAILARELRKPCIVGTQVATQILKNGDYVEVDAFKGVVKLIEH
jgi:phosphoenolpyruvate synthase/pyruvate phosphate dikinase